MKRALTIAGSDSGGGAGIQADLKAFSAFGVFGMSAITAITAQNTVAVTGVVELPLDIIARQIDAVVSDIGVDAVKTGMLANPAIVELVAEKVEEWSLPNLVVDPVMIAKSGAPLLSEEARLTVRDRLLPLAKVATPNLHEAAALVGHEIEDLEDMQEAAAELHAAGVEWVVVKGGHRSQEGEAMDVVFNGRDYEILTAPYIDTRNTHGTGCAFASAIAAGLAKGVPVLEAIRRAKQFITRAIETGLPLGKGHGPANALVDVTSPWQ